MSKNSDSISEYINFSRSTTKTPMLINLVLIKMAEYLDWEGLKSCREVCSTSTWNEIFTPKFRVYSQMKADLSSIESSTELESQFASKMKALNLIINPEENIMFPFNNWFHSYGSQLSRLTLENSIGLKFTKISNSFGELFEYCPNIKYLTLVNLKLKGNRVDPLYKHVVPKINLQELTIKSTTLERETDSFLAYCIDLIPCVFASNLLHVQKINVEFKSKSGSYIYITDKSYITDRNTFAYYTESSCAFKLFKKAVHLTFKNTSMEETGGLQRLSVGKHEFPNLERLQCSSNGRILIEMTDGCVPFPKLKFLNVPLCPPYYINYFLKCPNLMEIELSENVQNYQNSAEYYYVYLIRRYTFVLPNVQKLKVSLTSIICENIFNSFPYLKSLHVDIKGKNLVDQLAIISSHSVLKELTIIENSPAEEFQNAMENHLSSLLRSLKKLYIQTLNTKEIRSPDLLNIFTQKVANTPVEPTLRSVTLRGYKICSQQYDYVKHQLPFYLLIL